MMAHRDADALERDVRDLLDAVSAQGHAYNDQSLTVTLSGGLVRHPPTSKAGVPPSNAIRWADAALYAAKADGRNRVIHARTTPAGDTRLQERRPIDVAQLRDWQRQGHVTLDTIVPSRSGGA